MAKFPMNVCLKPCAIHEVHAALAAAMAPFDIDLSDDWNPVGEWDWWRIEAGRGERFVVIPAHDGDPRLIHAGDDREPLRCDGGPRGLLDFAAMRRQADGAAAWAVTKDALLTLEGQWINPRRLGPFAPPRFGEDAGAAYVRQSDGYLDGLAEDCTVVRLHCHC